MYVPICNASIFMSMYALCTIETSLCAYVPTSGFLFQYKVCPSVWKLVTNWPGCCRSQMYCKKLNYIYVTIAFIYSAFHCRISLPQG